MCECVTTNSLTAMLHCTQLPASTAKCTAVYRLLSLSSMPAGAAALLACVYLVYDLQVRSTSCQASPRLYHLGSRGDPDASLWQERKPNS